MSEWKSFTLSGVIPEEIPIILGEATAVIDSVAEVVDSIAGAADSASALLFGFIDPITAITEELRVTIQSFVDEFLTTGIYVLSVPVGRPSRGFSQTSDDFIDIIEKSLYDTADPNRPDILTTSGATAVILMVSAVTLFELIDASTALGELFGFEDLKIEGIALDFAVIATLTLGIVGSLTPQTIELTGDISAFPDSGSIKLGTEITSYTGKTATGLLGVTARTSHSSDEDVSLVSFGGKPEGSSTTLSEDIPGSGIETFIEVESTLGFPSSGSILIDDEEVEYSSRTDKTFEGVIITEDHSLGTPVILRKGRSFHGSPPDWENILLLEIFTEFNFIIKEIDNLQATLIGATDVFEQLSEFASRLVAKIDKMRERLSAIIEAVSRFVSLLSTSGVSILTVTGTGSLDDFIDKIRESEGKPDGSFTAGVVIMASVAGSPALLKLFGE